MVGMDVGVAGQRHVRAQHLEQDALGLECQHPAPRPHHGRERRGMGADIGADFGHHLAWFHKLPEQVRLTLRELAVAVERPADEAVGERIDREAVPAAPEPGIAPVEQNLARPSAAGQRVPG